MSGCFVSRKQVTYPSSPFGLVGTDRMWVFSLIFCACVLGLTSGQSCSRSGDCAVGQCCKSQQSHNLVDNPEGPFEMLLGEGNGQCVDGGAGPGEMCDSHCQCPSGYECYRRVTGVCCAPRTCITEAEANADRAYWQCHPPPPAARPDRRRRSVLFSSLCPQLPLAAQPQGPVLAP